MKLTRIKKIRDVLIPLGVPVNHYTAAEKPDNYIVWSEDSQYNSVWGDNHMTNQAIEGTIHYFTRTEYDPVADAIMDVLNDAEISFRLNSIQYEDETGYIHIEWVWRLE